MRPRATAWWRRLPGVRPDPGDIFVLPTDLARHATPLALALVTLVPGLAAADALTREEARARADSAHPGLAAMVAEAAARAADLDQAGARPNPELEVSFENFAGTGDASGLDALEATFALSQTLELGSKRSARLRVAALERDLADLDLAARRRQVRAEVDHAFAETLVAQRRLALADTLVAFGDELLAAVTRRVRAGGASLIEERRARVAAETDRLRRDDLARDLEIARAQLAAQWGGDPDFAAVDGDLAPARTPPPLAALLERLPRRPDARRPELRTAAQRAAADEARATGTPDVTLSGGLRRWSDTGDLAWIVGVSVPLPLADRRDGAKRAARHRVDAAEGLRLEQERNAESELRSLHARLVTTATESEAVRTRILPEAIAAFEEAQEAYALGRLRLTDVLDVERALFELHARELDLRADHRFATIELEHLLGEPVAPGEGN
ncbi:MAG: TolC family protein [bacterium]